MLEEVNQGIEGPRAQGQRPRAAAEDKQSLSGIDLEISEFVDQVSCWLVHVALQASGAVQFSTEESLGASRVYIRPDSNAGRPPITCVRQSSSLLPGPWGRQCDAAQQPDAHYTGEDRCRRPRLVRRRAICSPHTGSLYRSRAVTPEYRPRCGATKSRRSSANTTRASRRRSSRSISARFAHSRNTCCQKLVRGLNPQLRLLPSIAVSGFAKDDISLSLVPSPTRAVGLHKDSAHPAWRRHQCVPVALAT